MKECMVEVVVVTSPQRANAAVKFQRHFKDLLEGYFLASGKSHVNGNHNKYPLYEVVRLKKHGEEVSGDFVRTVNRRELFKVIPCFQKKTMREVA